MSAQSAQAHASSLAKYIHGLVGPFAKATLTATKDENSGRLLAYDDNEKLIKKLDGLPVRIGDFLLIPGEELIVTMPTAAP